MTRYWGSLSLDEIGKAVKTVPGKYKVSDEYGKQLVIDATMFDDGGIALSVYNKETQERIKIGSLRISQYQQEGATQAAPAPAAPKSNEPDLPF